MPELGAYAFEVTLAYAGSLALLGGLVVISILQSRRIRRRLENTEGRHTDA